jgi:hypothetical protein
MRLFVRRTSVVTATVLCIANCTSGTAPQPAEQALNGEWVATTYSGIDEGPMHFVLAVRGDSVSGGGYCPWGCWHDSLTVTGAVTGQRVQLRLVPFLSPDSVGTFVFNGRLINASRLHGHMIPVAYPPDSSAIDFSKPAN